jgi:hypothetical protein
MPVLEAKIARKINIFWFVAPPDTIMYLSKKAYFYKSLPYRQLYI